MCAHVKEEDLGVAGSSLLDDLVEGSARLSPWCPEVEEGDAVEVLGEERLEVLGRGNVDDVGGHLGMN